MVKKTLVFKKTEEGCIVPISHALNQDGYFRKRVSGKLIGISFSSVCQWRRDKII